MFLCWSFQHMRRICYIIQFLCVTSHDGSSVFHDDVDIHIATESFFGLSCQSNPFSLFFIQKLSLFHLHRCRFVNCHIDCITIGYFSIHRFHKTHFSYLLVFSTHHIFEHDSNLYIFWSALKKELHTISQT
jgi:hypothetical protein